jgi:streptogrisin C
VREQPSLATTADGVRRYLPADLRNDVTIHIQEEQVVHTQAIWGGMVAQSNQTWRCTGGFTITRSGTPSKGVATAGHCAGITHMLDPRNGNRTAVTLGDEYAGAWGDVEWYWSSVAENDDFFADTWDIRDVSSWEPASSISLNESICNFGWGGMVVHDCSAKVKDVSELCGIYGRMVVMDRIVTEVGDSGGPWFFNNRAFGIHSGTCLSGSHFSKVDHLDEALDVLVALS